MNHTAAIFLYTNRNFFTAQFPISLRTGHFWNLNLKLELKYDRAAVRATFDYAANRRFQGIL